MSLSIRLFVKSHLAESTIIPAMPTHIHYLSNVMRQRNGNPVRLFNGRDGEWQARISIAERRWVFVVEQRLQQQAPGIDLWLVFALLKRHATELVVQKATELGVSVILPVLTTRSQLARINLGRLENIAIEASEQCERMDVPEIRAPRPLADVLATWPRERRLAAAVERTNSPPLLFPARALLVGPEGGFTAEELDVLHQSPSVAPVTLGHHILRAETAVIAGLALLVAQSLQP